MWPPFPFVPKPFRDFAKLGTKDKVTGLCIKQLSLINEWLAGKTIAKEEFRANICSWEIHTEEIAIHSTFVAERLGADLGRSFGGNGVEDERELRICGISDQCADVWIALE